MFEVCHTEVICIATKTLNLFDEKKNYIINFWATWCIPCKKELPEFEKASKNLKKENINIYLISIDKKSIKDQLLFLRKNNIILLKSFFDPKMNFFNSLKLRGIPTTIVIKKNKVILKKEGIITFSKKTLYELKSYFN